ncbi:MAG: hypothetical protein ACR2P0_05745 [Acidimicrobiales bacterium]
MTPSTDGEAVSPYDTAASSATRFGIELVAWIAGPWAAADIFDSRWAALPTAVLLIGLPAVFNTPGDKNFTGIPTPGPIRITIEMFLMLVAVAAAWIVWPTWAAILVTVLAVALLATGGARYRWLLRVGASPGG